jgi:hypothetical protein
MYEVKLINRDDGSELESLMTPSLREAKDERDRYVADIERDGYRWYKGRAVTMVYVHPEGAGPDLGVEMRGNQ